MKSPGGTLATEGWARRGHGRCSGQAPAGRPRALFRPRPRRLQARPTARRRLADGYSSRVRARRAADRQAGDVRAAWKRAPEQEAELVASRAEALSRTPRRGSAGGAEARRRGTVTLARATSQRRPSDRATRIRTPDTDWAARVPAGGGGRGGGGGERPGRRRRGRRRWRRGRRWRGREAPFHVLGVGVAHELIRRPRRQNEVFPGRGLFVNDLGLAIHARAGQVTVVAEGLVVDLEVVRSGRDGSDRSAVRVRQRDREVGPDCADQARFALLALPQAARTSAAAPSRSPFTPGTTEAPLLRISPGQERPVWCLTSIRDGSRHRPRDGVMRIRRSHRKGRPSTGGRLRVLENHRVPAAGRAPAEDPRRRGRLIHRYRPTAVAIEESFVGVDARTALSVGQARGAADRRGRARRRRLR